MALLGKIREKSIFLIIVIGLALFAFVISGALGNGNSDDTSNDPIGIVDGKEIPLENFRFMVEQTERNFGLTTMQAVDNVWKQYIRNFVFENQFEILGIDAGRDQIEQVVSSTESIINDERFINEAGFFDFGLFTDFIVQMKNTNPQAYESWKQQELSIISSAKENIYFDLPPGFEEGFEDGDESFFIQEWVPKGETVDNWSQMLTLTVQDVANLNPVEFFNHMADGWEEACPEYGGMLLHEGRENNYPVAVWFLKCPTNPMTSKPEADSARVNMAPA